MSLPDLPFNCELECLCMGDFAQCPNVQAFGAAALGLVQKYYRAPETQPAENQPDPNL